MAKISKRWIIGIDEVGRGCLAGSVTVAALAMPKDLRFKIKDLKIPLKDSKKLSAKQRDVWFQYIKSHPQIFYAIAGVSPQMIDRINISNAANLAASRSLFKLLKKISDGLINKTIDRYDVFLDGGLYLGTSRFKNKDLRIKSKTIIRGDEKIPAIALASIVAKVTRDRKMKNLHKKYPRYGFDEHKGYGTKKHRSAIKKHGLSTIHRRSFRVR